MRHPGTSLADADLDAEHLLDLLVRHKGDGDGRHDLEVVGPQALGVGGRVGEEGVGGREVSEGRWGSRRAVPLGRAERRRLARAAAQRAQPLAARAPPPAPHRTLNSAPKPSSRTVRTKQSTMPRYATTLPWSLCSSRAPCQPDTWRGAGQGAGGGPQRAAWGRRRRPRPPRTQSLLAACSRRPRAPGPPAPPRPPAAAAARRRRGTPPSAPSCLRARRSRGARPPTARVRPAGRSASAVRP
jgi:hypothetical protein